MGTWNHGISYRLTQPYRIEAVEREVQRQRSDDVLVRPRVTTVCGSDLKLYTGSRDRRALSKKLPLALLHEGVAEVVETGPGVQHVRPGSRVVVVPNIPCYLAYPEQYPSKEEGCHSCRPGGAGENYCLNNLYLSSNTDGLAQSVFRHPGGLVLPVPAEVPDNVAVLTEPMTTVVAGCQKAPIRPDRRYLILGNGPIGLLTAIALVNFYGVPRDAIWMTGRDWSKRENMRELIGTPLDGNDERSMASIRSSIDVAFECVGGEANEMTLSQAIDCLRPGGTAILFGPSEKAIDFNTREVVGKGLAFVGANRSYVPHFEWVISHMVRREVQRQLETIVSPECMAVRSADDLNQALYAAWTKREPHKTLISWPGLE
jgi:ribitol-5-phosphate 2-dehydrogenase